MATKKLYCIKYANSIRFGKGEETFITTEKGIPGGYASSIDLVDGMAIRMVDARSGKITNSSLLNALWWQFMEDVEPKVASEVPATKAKSSKAMSKLTKEAQI